MFWSTFVFLSLRHPSNPLPRKRDHESIIPGRRRHHHRRRRRRRRLRRVLAYEGHEVISCDELSTLFKFPQA